MRTARPASSATIVRCTWPATTRSTWRVAGQDLGERLARLVGASPIRSKPGISVRSGGWCIAITVGRSGVLGERRVEPLEPPFVERPAFGAGDDRVEADQPQRPEVDDVGGRLLARARQPERLAQRPAQVVVAGQDVRLEPERRQQLAHSRAYSSGAAVVGQVAGDEQRVGPVGRAPGSPRPRAAGMPPGRRPPSPRRCGYR